MVNRILVDFKATARMFFRSKSAIFWTLAFPIILMVIFGAIFSGLGEATYSLYIQDKDGTQTSQQFIEALKQTGALNVVMVDPNIDADQYIKDNSLTTFMIIPLGFQEAVISGGTQNVTLDLRLDQTSTSAGVVSGIVGSVAEAWNLQIAHAVPTIFIHVGGIISDGFNFIDFFLPGVIGLTIMTSAVNYMVSINTRYRNAGMFAKFTTTPFKRIDFLLSRMLWQLVVTAMSVAAILLVGVGLFGVNVNLDAISILLLIFGSVLFSAMGMAMARFIKEEETAETAAAAVTFPMMFLAGSFFPLESMPSYLQTFAQVLPLTYLNDGLRDSMIYGNYESALFNLGVVAVIAVVLMVFAVAVTRWKTD
ncbi:MAG: ABC transporter permease [Methanomassiliicoccales archaeon]|nr:ABC transporter permease [Methanomassiliicoccales archaeon]NYT15516.1 ABC transporter permease [Methanomassiliicoccales archaeon]